MASKIPNNEYNRQKERNQSGIIDLQHRVLVLDQEERRKSERFKVELPVSFEISKHTFFGTTANLSDDGMMIESSLALGNVHRIFKVFLKTEECPIKVNYSIKGTSFSRRGKIKHYHLDFSGVRSASRFSFGVWIPKLRTRDQKGL